MQSHVLRSGWRPVLVGLVGLATVLAVGLVAACGGGGKSYPTLHTRLGTLRIAKVELPDKYPPTCNPDSSSGGCDFVASLDMSGCGTNYHPCRVVDRLLVVSFTGDRAFKGDRSISDAESSRLLKEVVVAPTAPRQRRTRSAKARPGTPSTSCSHSRQTPTASSSPGPGIHPSHSGSNSVRFELLSGMAARWSP
jgi:hypothetical protein